MNLTSTRLWTPWPHLLLHRDLIQTITMKLITLACVAASAAAFSTGSVERPATALNMDRRAAAGQIAAGAAVIAGLPNLALADGAKSAATVSRARGIYGQRIAALEDAVSKGDFGAVAAEKNAFILYNSGAITSKDKQAAAVKQTNAIFAAIRGKDAGALKKAYGDYKSAQDIAVIVVDKEKGQGYSNDYDFKTRTNLG